MSDTNTDFSAFADRLIETVLNRIDQKMAPLNERMARLEAVEPKKGLDGVGFKSALIDRKGALVVTDTNGNNSELGAVVGRDGKDAEPVDLDALRAQMEEMIADAVSEIPKAVDGENGEKGEAGEAGPQGEAGEQGEKGDVGEKGDIGPQGEKGDTGENGEKGLDGKDGQQGEKGDVGEKGLDGKDGLGFDDLVVEHDGERGFKFVMRRDGREKSFDFSIPAMIYQGVYKSDGNYSKGDAVTYGGSLWHCNTDKTKDSPGTSSDWTLSAKKGTDGKSGKDGLDGKRGIQGPRGKDFTRLGANV